jgi:colanic acid/amylovoran biosynthesis glycosyltransferase
VPLPRRELPSLKVGYVLKKYPRLSETFVLDEILGVEEAGLEVFIHSLLLPNDGRFHAGIARVRGAARYLPTLAERWSTFGAFRALRDLGAPAAAQDRAVNFLDRFPGPYRSMMIVQALHLAGQAKTNGLDHLHAHFMTSPAQTTYLAHIFSGIPFSVTAHAVDIYGPTVDRSVVKEIAEAAMTVVTVCEANRRHIEQLVGDSCRIDVIYNGISVDDQPPVSGWRDRRLLLAVGRFVEKKGYHVLLEACRILRDQGIDFRCLLIGEGKERERLLDQRRRLGLEQLVEMPGSMAREQVLYWMRRARAFAAPCVIAADGDRDALPTVLLEALSVGLPVVSTEVGGIPEIVDSDIEGLLVPEGNPAALADALRRLLIDDELWLRLSAAGSQKAATRFDRSKNLPRLIDLFRQSARGEAVLEAVP